MKPMVGEKLTQLVQEELRQQVLFEPGQEQFQKDFLRLDNTGLLNPDWIEWFMGWPMGWTELEPLEMDKFLEWQRQHG